MESSLVFSQFFSCDSDLFSAKPERIYTAGKFHTDICCPCRIAAKRPQRGFAFSAVNDNAQNPCDMAISTNGMRNARTDQLNGLLIVGLSGRNGVFLIIEGEYEEMVSLSETEKPLN